jgi:hypothetical protein
MSETDTDAPVAESMGDARKRLANEVAGLGVSGMVIYYSVLSLGWVGAEVGFFNIPWSRPMLAGLLLVGLGIDRFATESSEIPPVVVGYTVLGVVVAGTSAGVLNMPLPPETVSGFLLGLLSVDYFTQD